MITRGDLDLAVLAHRAAPPVVPAGPTRTRILEDPVVVASADDHQFAWRSEPPRVVPAGG